MHQRKVQVYIYISTSRSTCLAFVCNPEKRTWSSQGVTFLKLLIVRTNQVFQVVFCCFLCTFCGFCDEFSWCFQNVGWVSMANVRDPSSRHLLLLLCQPPSRHRLFLGGVKIWSLLSQPSPDLLTLPSKCL